MTQETLNPFLQSCFDLCKDAKDNENKTIKIAHELGASVKAGVTNVISLDDLMTYAKGESQKGWLTEYLSGQSAQFRAWQEQAKDRENKAIKEDAKRSIKNLSMLMNKILLIAAMIASDEKSYKVLKRGVLETTNEDGESVVMSAESAMKQARKSFGRTKKVAPSHDNPTEGVTRNKLSMIEVLDFIASNFTGKDYKDFSPDIIEAVELVHACLDDVLDTKVHPKKVA